MRMPWRTGVLRSWSIVGMNHYNAEGQRRLYVAMAKGERCIKEEGLDVVHLWERLEAAAADYERLTP